MPQEMVEKQKQKAIKQAVKLLVSLGLIKDTDVSVAETNFFGIKKVLVKHALFY